MKKIILAVVLLIILAVNFLSMRQYTKKTTAAADTSTLTTEKATSITETKKAPETAISSEISKQAEIETTTAETTTENYPEIYTEKPNGMIFYNEQGEHKKSLGRFYITGYTAEEGFQEGSATASGVGCRPGICAMNNQQRKELGIKYGDSIYIDGLGTYQVQDCGCAYGVIDIWFHDNATAYHYTGYYDVYI